MLFESIGATSTVLSSVTIEITPIKRVYISRLRRIASHQCILIASEIKSHYAHFI